MTSPRFRTGLLLALIISPAGRADPGAAGTEYTHVTVLGTTDLHGHIFPMDYYTNRPAQLGLAKVATLIANARLGAPHLLLLDSGDTIQGSPLEYYHNRVDNAPPDPMMLAMNYLHYDAMTVGNHDYNYGPAVQKKAHAEASFPWLSANTYLAGTDVNAFQPYIVKDVNGVRVGVLGLTTPDIPYWDDPADFAGLEFRSPLTEAKKWVAVLRTREHADVVVIAMHMGLERDLGTNQPLIQLPHENQAMAIAEEVPGVDLILMGHTHLNIPSLTINGVLLTQADYWGYYLARADLYLKRSPGGPWTVWAKQAATIPVTKSVDADPAVLRLAAGPHEATLAWLQRKVGESAKALDLEGALRHDTAIMDLVERAMLEFGHADVAMAAPLSMDARIPQGPVSVRDIAGVYIYDNYPVVIEITGAELKAALEHAAQYQKPYVPGKAGWMGYATWPYTFDTAIGVDYVIDLTQPAGHRIRDLQFHGAPLDPNRKLRVVITNYRYNGGGGFPTLKGAPVVSTSSEEIRNVIIDWVEQHHQIPTEPLNNWRIVPSP